MQAVHLLGSGRVLLHLAALLDVDPGHVDVDVGPDELGWVGVLHEVVVARAQQAAGGPRGEGHQTGPGVHEEADDGEDGEDHGEESVAGVGKELPHDRLVGCLPVLVRDHLCGDRVGGWVGRWRGDGLGESGCEGGQKNAC